MNGLVSIETFTLLTRLDFIYETKKVLQRRKKKTSQGVSVLLN